MNRNENETGLTRRTFLRQSAVVAAAAASTRLITPVYGQNVAPSANAAGANSRLVGGFIGVGNQGMNSHLKPILKSAQENGVAVAAVCDVSKHRVEEGKQAVADSGGKAEGFEDYRKLLERRDIDFIFCATVDHWHARVCVESLNAGKHVYVEKPMTRYMGEAFEVHDAVKKTGKLLQVGSQGCSDRKWQQAADWIKAGKIGPVVMAQGAFPRNAKKGEWNYDFQEWAKPEDINWKLWVGDQIKKKKPEFNVDDYFRWRKYYPYCAGLLGDLFPHRLHPCLKATASEEFPIRVAAVGDKKFQSDKPTTGTPERDVPEILQMIAEFPSGMTMHFYSTSLNDRGTPDIIRGQKGNLNMSGNSVQRTPERVYADEVDDAETSPEFPPESIPVHQKNFFDSVRGAAKLNCPIDLAIRVQTIISLAEMSERLGVVCFFDAATRKITISDGAGGRKEIAPITYGTLELS